MIALLNRALNALSGLLMRPLLDASPWLAMLVFAAGAALLTLALFRLCTNPARIRRRKNRVLARIMEMAIYQDDPIVNLSAAGRALAANAVYVVALLPAAAASLLPLLLVLVQVHAWLGLRPLADGEACLVTVQLAPRMPAISTAVDLRTSPGLRVETPGVRQPAERAVTWRLRATAPTGAEWLEIGVDGQALRVALAAGKGLQPKAGNQAGADTLARLANPAATAFPPQAPIDRIEIQYPEYAYRAFGHSWSWITAFLALSLLIAWPLQRPFGVVV